MEILALQRSLVLRQKIHQPSLFVQVHQGPFKKNKNKRQNAGKRERGVQNIQVKVDYAFSSSVSRNWILQYLGSAVT